MSFNRTIDRFDRLELALTSKLLETFKNDWRNQSFLDEQYAFEHRLINLMSSLEESRVQPRYVSSLEDLYYEKLNEEFSNKNLEILLRNSTIDALIKKYEAYFNYKKNRLLSLEGAISRVYQKLAILNITNKKSFKYSIDESFDNKIYIDNKKISGTPLSIDTDAGVLTLPIFKENTHFPARVDLNSNGNGSPGSVFTSSPDIKNTLPSYIFDGIEDSFFEYERLDNGPLKLVMDFVFSNEEIHNRIELFSGLGNSSGAAKIQDIVFKTDSGVSVSIYKLLHSDQELYLNEDNAEARVVINFLPINASSVSISFLQENKKTHVFKNSEDILVERDVYNISLSKILFKSIKYSSSGGCRSSFFDVNSGLYSCKSLLRTYPKSQNLFTSDLKLSFDNGFKWQQAVLNQNDESQSFVLDGSGKKCGWNLTLTRNDEKLKEFTSFTEEFFIKNLKNTLVRASRDVSPQSIHLNEVIIDSYLKVAEVNLGRRDSLLRKAKHLGYINKNGETRLSFPASLNELNIEIEDLIVFVNNIEWEAVYKKSDLADKKYLVTNNTQEIVFDVTDLNDSTVYNVKYLFREELPFVEERSNGYYIKLKSPFDSDQKTIELKTLSSSPVTKELTLPQGTTRVNLGYTYITRFEMSAEEGLVVPEGSDTYELDKISGILTLKAGYQNKFLSVVFSYYPLKEIDSSSYDLWFNESSALGLIVNKEYLPVEVIIDTLDKEASLLERMDVRTGEVSSRNQIGSDKVYALSERNIIKNSVSLPKNIFLNQPAGTKPEEVSFYDGVAEFYGLAPIYDEKIANIQYGDDGIVEFSLSAGISFYDDYPIRVLKDGLDFPVTKVSNLQDEGHYSVDNDKKIKIKLDDSETAGVSDLNITYFYQDPLKRTQWLYSVDYEQGVIHFSDNLTDNTQTVTYKTCSLSVAYNLANFLEDFTYDSSKNVLEFHTEGLREQQGKLKVYWAEKEIATNLFELKDYFSPLIYQITMGFE